MNRIETDQLADLIGKKHQVLEQLREQSRRQTELIDGSESEKLLTVLGTKQALIDELQKIERQLDPFRSQDPDQRIWRSPGDRKAAQQLAQRCENLLQEIMLLDKQAELQLQQRRQTTATQLQAAHHASHAANAYHKGQGGGGRHLDISS